MLQTDNINYIEYIFKAVDSLAWPVSILIIILIFRKELSAVLSQLSNLEYKGFKANFGNKLQDVEQKIKEIKRTEVEDSNVESELTINQENDYDRIMRIAEISPRAAISEAWSEVEAAARKAAAQADLKIKKPESVKNIVKAFIENNKQMLLTPNHI